MSDLTSLTGEYAENAEFVKAFNDALLALRKQQLRSVQDERSGSRVRNDLTDLISHLVAGLNRDAVVNQPLESVPKDVVDRLRERHKADLSWFVKELREIASDLSRGGRLNDKQVSRLEEVCEAADAAATAVFRRLWRR